MIERIKLLSRIKGAFEVNRIVCLLGPRQCGKTTLARALWQENGKKAGDTGYFDLESPVDLEFLENPELALTPLKGLIVIDEIQRRPDLFPFLRYLHDLNLDQKFLILGSASRDLINQSSESLAGRISFIEITPFNLAEVDSTLDLWIKGGFPKSYLLSNQNSLDWRMEYVRTYIEHDFGALGLNFNPDILRKMWFMMANYHGQIFNHSELAGSLNISSPTVKRYLSYLEASFMVRVLSPWFENIKKRQVKSPKVYFRDSGILHYFLGIRDENTLRLSPKIGASWEGFALEQVCRFMQADNQECFFWATHNDAELDLLIMKNGKKTGFEFKYNDAPKLSPSMKISMETLGLEELNVIYPGEKNYQLAGGVNVVGLRQYIVRSKTM